MMISLQAINLHRILSVVCYLVILYIVHAFGWSLLIHYCFMDKQTVFFEDYHELVRNVWESGLELGDVELRACP